MGQCLQVCVCGGGGGCSCKRGSDNDPLCVTGTTLGQSA